ncbi:unnamed protein product [Sphagnum tenellum]
MDGLARDPQQVHQPAQPGHGRDDPAPAGQGGQGGDPRDPARRLARGEGAGARAAAAGQAGMEPHHGGHQGRLGRRGHHGDVPHLPEDAAGARPAQPAAGRGEHRQGLGFTLLMRNNKLFVPARRALFQILTEYARDPREVNERVLRMLQQLTTPNSCELTSRTMKEIVDLSGEFGVDFEELFLVKDSDGNNLLMELAKNMKDDALREILTNNRTANFITHSVLLSKNMLGQTLLTLIEVNRESLSESLPLVLKREYGCHRRDMIKTELCLSEQLETSASASEIIQELHQLEPKNWCQIFVIWATLFLTSLTPNIALAFGDIFSDAYLVVEYHSNMQNVSYMQTHEEICRNLKNESPIPLEAYASCLDSRSQFYYTITFLLIPLIFYLTEFLTLRPEYEPTGLRRKLRSLWSDLRTKGLSCLQYLAKSLQLLVYLLATTVALILWQPVTAFCKFYRDARYEASEGTTKVIRRKEKRLVDLAASRGELIEVSIEAVFEPMVQGYIIFPSIIGIIKRLSESVTVGKDGTLQIEFALRGHRDGADLLDRVSMVSLAWCFSEYNSVPQDMLLDITVSPCSRIVMCFFMLFQVVARLLAFMLFTLFWGPGNFYPLLIFVGIHMILAATLHIVFSEDIVFFKKGLYLKFFHNVMINSFASIYFHNYLRFDEMPITRKPDSAHAQLGTMSPTATCQQSKIEIGEKSEETFEFIDGQRPGLHISTFLRQLMFDILYSIEYVRPPGLRVQLGGQGPDRPEEEAHHHLRDPRALLPGAEPQALLLSRHARLELRHIETTLIVLPKSIIEAIKGRGQDLEYNFTDVTRQVDRSWFSSPKEVLSQAEAEQPAALPPLFPLVILVIVINLVIIALLIIGLV